MQSKKMRFVAAALAGAMAITMAACGSRDDDTSAGDGGSSVEAPTSDAAGSDAAGSDAAGSDAAGSDAAGSDAAGSDAAGSDSSAPASGGGSAANVPGGGAPADGEDTNIKIAYIPWDEDVAVTHLWQQVLTDLGYKVEIQQLDVSPTFDAIANSKANLYFDVWLPVTHEPQWKEYKDKVEDLGIWYDQATLNIAVPEYMTDINTIDDLANVADQVNGQIIGIESGAGLTRVTQAMLDEKGFDLDLKTSGTPAMLAALEKATKAEEPIVVTLWHPHWAYSAYPIKDLEDPDGVMGDKEEIHAIGNPGFTEDHPGIAAMVQNFTMTDEQLASLENLVLRENKNAPEEGVAAWLEENPDFVAGLTG